MCVIFFSFGEYPEYPLILAANRDEFYRRATRPAAVWQDAPNILGGRDEEQGGTWLGATRDGRGGAITNFREKPDPDKQSRGLILSGFLSGVDQPGPYLRSLESEAQKYNGFNVLLGTTSEVFYYSNRGGGLRKLSPGLYGLSNAVLDTPWPKVEAGKEELRRALETGPDTDRLLGLLADETKAPDDQLPQTGIPVEFERLVSSRFIRSPIYGTRASTVLVRRADGHTVLEEQSFLVGGQPGPRVHLEWDIVV